MGSTTGSAALRGCRGRGRRARAAGQDTYTKGDTEQPEKTRGSCQHNLLLHVRSW